MVPAFPPKKIFTLTPAEVEQRREQLEKYMQAGMFLMWDGPSFRRPRLCFDLTYVWVDFPAPLLTDSLAVFNRGPSFKRLRNNRCAVFCGPTSKGFFWKETVNFAESEFERNLVWIESRFGAGWRCKRMNKRYWPQHRGFVLILWSTGSYSRTRERCLSVYLLIVGEHKHTGCSWPQVYPVTSWLSA